MRNIVVVIVLLLSGVHGARAESCRDSAGYKFAKKLAEQCLNESSATFPPCSVDATCDQMHAHIRQMCQRGLRPGEPLPASKRAPGSEAWICEAYLETTADIVPSFDCAKAQSPTEKAICASAELAKADLDVAATYRRALATESTTPDEQRAWLKQRDAACNADGRDKCLLDMMEKRTRELHYNGLGITASPPARSLRYEDLIGTWEARAIRVFGERFAISNIGNDDDMYLGSIVAFEPTRIVWQKGTERRPASEENSCAAPMLTPLPTVVAEPYEIVGRNHSSYQKVPGAYAVHCGGKVWGPPNGAVIKGVSADNVRLYWWDGAILTLKRVKN